MKVMILYRDPRWIGGVVSFIESLRRHFDCTFQSEQYQVGLRFGNPSKLLAPLIPFHDAVGLFLALCRMQPDVVHLNPSLNFTSVLRDSLFMFVLRMLGRKSVLVFWHGWESGVSNRIRESYLLRNFFLASFGRAGHTVVLAGCFRDELIAIGLPPDRVSVESTMFDGALFNDVTRREHTGKTLLFLSRMEPTKGIFEIVDAYARLKERFPATRLVMAGDGPARKDLEKLVVQLGVRDVSFPGYLRGRDKAQTLVNADLFIFPTYYGEGCPISLLEAMASGLPCITNAIGGIPEIFQDGLNGILLNGVTTIAVEEALEKLLGDPGKCALMAENNRVAAWGKYEASIVTKRIQLLYHEVAKFDAIQ
jgi:glycosyltransferase involved in cell wall biosynthesis